MVRIRRWLASLGITAYLTALLYGIVSHAASYNESAHPSMYFIVWDMFCGWSAYENRTHIIGQGVSGKYYELSPGPWSDYHPFGDISRQNYDSFNNHPDVIALNCLRHTQHEPMTRLYVIEENWAKKYNLPESVWQRMYNEPKEPYSYFRVRKVMNPNGAVVFNTGPWLSYQTNLTITDNPRLMAVARKSVPMLSVNLSRDNATTDSTRLEGIPAGMDLSDGGGIGGLAGGNQSATPGPGSSSLGN